MKMHSSLLTTLSELVQAQVNSGSSVSDTEIRFASNSMSAKDTFKLLPSISTEDQIKWFQELQYTWENRNSFLSGEIRDNADIGTPLMFTYTKDSWFENGCKQFRVWHKSPYYLQYNHVDSCGECSYLFQCHGPRNSMDKWVYPFMKHIEPARVVNRVEVWGNEDLLSS